MGPELAKEWAATYLGAVGADGLDISDAPFDDGARSIVGWINATLGIQSDCLPADECRLENGTDNWEGTSDGVRFVPDKPDELPNIGTVCTLRFATATYRVIVLEESDGELGLAAIPKWKERRQHRRIASKGFAVVRLGSRESKVTLGDLCEGGIGFDSPFIVEAGQHLDLLLRIEGKRQLAFECEGLVVNCRKPKRDKSMDCWLGVQFEDLPEDVRDNIRRMVEDTDA